MILLVALLPLFLAHVDALGPSASITPLSDEKIDTVFEEVNKKFVRDPVWSTDLAEKALGKSERPRSPGVKGKWHKNELVLKGRGPFNAIGELKGKLRDQLTSLLKQNEEELGRIPPRSHYGCDGYVTKMEEGSGSFRFVCIYKWD